MNDYELALKYLRICFDQAVMISENEWIYDAENNRVSISDVEDFLKVEEEIQNDSH